MKRRCHDARWTRRAVVPVVLLAMLSTPGCLLTACGGADDGTATPAASAPAPSASTPAPGSSPLPGSPEQAVAAYWSLVDADAYERLATVCVPGSAAAVSRATDDIARVRLLRVARVAREAGGAQAQVDVRVTPAEETTPWGAAGRHTLFMQLQESGSGWLVASWGTSP